jgi:hypothetical protein
LFSNDRFERIAGGKREGQALKKVLANMGRLIVWGRGKGPPGSVAARLRRSQRRVLKIEIDPEGIVTVHAPEGADVGEIARRAAQKGSWMRLALDGHLTLSVYFVNHARAQLGRIISLADKIQMSETEFFYVLKGIKIDDDRVFATMKK